MTEEEAKEKWCPFVRTALVRNNGDDTYSPVAHGYNRLEFESLVQGRSPKIYSDGSEVECRCVGSICMAWRWGSPELSEDGLPVETWPDLVPFHPAGRKMFRHGFCGLVGKP